MLCQISQTSYSHGVVIKFQQDVSPKMLDILNIRVDSPSLPNTLVKLNHLLNCPVNDFYFQLPRKYIDQAGLREPVEIIISLVARPNEQLVFYSECGSRVTAQRSLVLGKCKTLDMILRHDGPQGRLFQCRDHSLEAVHLFVQHLYYGDVSRYLTNNSVVDVCLLADQFYCPELLTDGVKFIGQNMTGWDGADLLNLAYHYHLGSLVEEVAMFMLDCKDSWPRDILNWVYLIEEEETEYLRALFTAFHNVFVKYLKGAYIPYLMGQQQRDHLAHLENTYIKRTSNLSKNVYHDGHFKEMGLILKHFQKGLAREGDEA